MGNKSFGSACVQFNNRKQDCDKHLYFLLNWRHGVPLSFSVSCLLFTLNYTCNREDTFKLAERVYFI